MPDWLTTGAAFVASQSPGELGCGYVPAQPPAAVERRRHRCRQSAPPATFRACGSGCTGIHCGRCGHRRRILRRAPLTAPGACSSRSTAAACGPARLNSRGPRRELACLTRYSASPRSRPNHPPPSDCSDRSISRSRSPNRPPQFGRHRVSMAASGGVHSVVRRDRHRRRPSTPRTNGWRMHTKWCKPHSVGGLRQLPANRSRRPHVISPVSGAAQCDPAEVRPPRPDVFEHGLLNLGVRATR